MQFTTIAFATGLLATAMAAPSQLEARQAGRTIPLLWKCSSGVTYAFIGCYVDDSRRFIGTQAAIEYPVKGVGACMEKAAASGSAYAALQNGNECLKANDFNRPMKIVSPAECNRACTGSNEYCGAPWRNQVYARVGTAQLLTQGTCPKPQENQSSYGDYGY